MYLKIRVLFLLFCLQQTMMLSGQNHLSLADALSTGLKNHYGIRMARNSNLISQKNVSLGNAGILPLISAYGSIDKASLDSKVKTVTGGNLDIKAANATLTTAGLQAQWTLFDGTSMFLEYEKLKSIAHQSDLELQISIENAISAITAAYCDIIRQYQVWEACQKRLDISNMQVKLARLKFQSGSGSEQEMIQARVIRQADTVALTRQWAAVKKAKIYLNQLLAGDLTQEFITEDSITLVNIPLLEDLIKSALTNNNDYLMAEEQTRMLQLDVKSLQAKQLPKLVFKGSYAYYENDTKASFISLNQTLGPQIGISAYLNIFDGFNQRRKITNAKISYENEQIRQKEQEQIITARVMNAWFDHLSYLQAVALGKEGLSLAQKNISIATDAYQAGLISSLQLREAQEDLFNASSALFDALFQARVTENELLRLSGGLVKNEK